MPGLRDQLFELGWRQGSIIDVGAINHPTLTGDDPFLIINQTCDLIHDQIETEPFAELLRLRRIKPHLKKIRKQIEPHQALIDTLFIRVDPLREVSGDDSHAVRLLIAVKKATLDEPDKLQALHSMAGQLDSIFESAKGLDLEAPVNVQSLNKITLAQVQDYLEWNRYDYLSFGEDD